MQFSLVSKVYIWSTVLTYFNNIPYALYFSFIFTFLTSMFYRHGESLYNLSSYMSRSWSTQKAPMTFVDYWSELSEQANSLCLLFTAEHEWHVQVAMLIYNSCSSVPNKFEWFSVPVYMISFGEGFEAVLHNHIA